MRDRDLQCPNSCSDACFEALNAPVFVDRRARYLSHDSSRATYVCKTCQSVAIDVAAAAQEMSRRGFDPGVTLTCPTCQTIMLPPIDDPLASVVECPVCSTHFAIEEGFARVHGVGTIDIDDEDEAEPGG